VPAWYEVRTASTYRGVHAIEIRMRDPSYLRAFPPLRCETPLWGLHCRWKIYMMRVSELPRPSPERLLLQAQAEENKRWGARLKIFLGYAAGVGKSYRMLDEARRRHDRGEDVVVGAIQPQQSEDLHAILQQLELIPPLPTSEGQTLDLEAVLRRAPQVCVIDPLAATNPPGSRNSHRWQDVQELLRSGISVLTSVNLLHVEGYKEKVQAITGKDTAETIPKSFLLAADDIVIVDVPTDLCLSRLGEKLTSIGISNSQERQLSELRELALLLTAEVVDAQLESYVHAHGIKSVFGTQERFLVCITPDSNALAMIESGRRNKERFQGELHVLYVRRRSRSEHENPTMETYLDAARRAGAATEVLESDDPITAITQFAREKRITQIFIGHGSDENWRDRFFGGPVLRLMRAAEGIDVRVFPR
jgi:two-component system, OmpR family, sensor histidine kinase KdpD